MNVLNVNKRPVGRTSLVALCLAAAVGFCCSLSKSVESVLTDLLPFVKGFFVQHGLLVQVKCSLCLYHASLHLEKTQTAFGHEGII